MASQPEIAGGNRGTNAVAHRLAELSSEKRDLLECLSKRRHANATAVARRRTSVTAPLLPSQRRLWLLHQLAPKNPFYNESVLKHLRMDLDAACFERALNELVRRHESLRITFRLANGEPAQVIHSRMQAQVPVVDLRPVPVEQREPRARNLIREAARVPFDLQKGPCFRVVLYRLDSQDWLLSWTFHHLILDGRSLGPLSADLDSIYQALLSGPVVPLDPLPVSYSDFVFGQQNRDPAVLEPQLAYWKAQMAGLKPLELPLDLPRPDSPAFSGARCAFSVPDSLHQQCKELAAREQAPLFMLLMSAFAVLLFRHTGQDDIVLGVPFANRSRSELKSLIGFLVNTLPLRLDCSGNPRFTELLRRVRQVTHEAYAHKDIPFDSVIDELRIERQPNRNPLFQVAFQYLNETHSGPLAITVADAIDIGTAKFDLRLDFLSDGHSLHGYLEYSTELFRPETAANWVSQLEVLLEEIVRDPEWRIDRICLARGRDTSAPPSNRTPHDAEVTFVDIFRAQAKEHAECTAVSLGETRLSYAELDRRSGALAAVLQARGIGRETIVGLFTERSLDMIIGLLAILKAGGAYLPVDPRNPKRRTEFLLDDSHAAVVLTQQHLLPLVPDGFPAICLDELEALKEPVRARPIANRPQADKLPHIVRPEGLAYVIYTSGSTGQPKGVLVEHRGLPNVIAEQRRLFRTGPGWRVLQFASLSFDASVFEILMALGSGAELCLAREEDLLPGPVLAEFLRSRRINAATLLPSALREIPAQSLPDLRVLAAAGESCPPDLVKTWQPGRTFLNLYGPTEATIWSTASCNPEITPNRRVPIGTALNGVNVHVLDGNLHPVPEGVPGELFIGGIGVARGYLNRPDLTTERFLRLPHAGGERVYRSGDIVRVLPDGSLEFLRRADHQVKLRGYRIELGEIESAILAHPAVKECVVATRENARGERHLAAYIVPRFDESGPFSTVERHSKCVLGWQRLHDITYGQPGRTEDPRFNAAGWNSSYTGLPISEEELREQTEHTAERVMRSQPRRVLEIGCGTGLLLFRLAPRCHIYVATDVSSAALESVRSAGADKMNQVMLLERAADNLHQIPGWPFDAIVLNSVVQYFPDTEYLMRVLRGAMELLTPGGVIFIGDVRNHALLEAFHAGVELYRSGSGRPSAELSEAIRRRIRQERELVIAPQLFAGIAEEFSEIGCLEVMLKRGRAHNELTRYRYDVAVHKAAENPAGEDDTRQPVFVNRTEKAWADTAGFADIREMLRSNVWDELTITAVPDARVRFDTAVLELLKQAQVPENVKALRKAAAHRSHGIDPDHVYQLSAEFSYSAHVSPPAAGRPDCFDIVFRRGQDAGQVNWKGLRAKPACWSQWANHPASLHVGEDVVTSLRTWLRERLPEYMVPSSFTMLDTLPRTLSGKVNRAALPPDHVTPAHSAAFFGPANDLERQIAAIWAELLGIERVGVLDNFFDLGGHSLLLISVQRRLEEALGSRHSVVDLFRFPTIRSLAKHMGSRELAATAANQGGRSTCLSPD